MSEPKISILVPSFNQGRYISNLVKSVVGQSYSNWELIIQDGGSKDETTEVCNKFVSQDNRISYRTEKDSGFADAVNRAIDRATGSVGIIQSSDDFFSAPSALHDAAKYFTNNPNLVLVGGSAVVVDDQLRELAVSERTTGYVTAESVYRITSLFSQSATFFSIPRARTIGKLDQGVDMVADTDFWIRLACVEGTQVNTLFHTSQIWGAAMIQPGQRSANLSKFHLGRAKMFLGFVNNNRIAFSTEFKKDVADTVIRGAIRHFELNKIDSAELRSLYQSLHGKPYVQPPLSMRARLSRALRGNREVRTPNSIHELYLSNPGKATLYNHGWFNSNSR